MGRASGLHGELHKLADRGDCPRCDGDGNCWPCKGSGDGLDGGECQPCEGTGRCPMCGGSGDAPAAATPVHTGIEDTARRIRTAYQGVGISTPTDWASLPDYRKQRHIDAANLLDAAGWALVSKEEAITKEDRAAIGRARAFIEAFCRPDADLPPLPIFATADLARLARLAKGGGS